MLSFVVVIINVCFVATATRPRFNGGRSSAVAFVNASSLQTDDRSTPRRKIPQATFSNHNRQPSSLSQESTSRGSVTFRIICDDKDPYQRGFLLTAEGTWTLGRLKATFKKGKIMTKATYNNKEVLGHLDGCQFTPDQNGLDPNLISAFQHNPADTTCNDAIKDPAQDFIFLLDVSELAAQAPFSIDWANAASGGGGSKWGFGSWKRGGGGGAIKKGERATWAYCKDNVTLETINAQKNPIREDKALQFMLEFDAASIAKAKQVPDNGPVVEVEAETPSPTETPGM